MCRVENVLAAGEFEHEHLVEARDCGEVERIEALDRREAGLPDAPLDDPMEGPLPGYLMLDSI